MKKQKPVKAVSNKTVPMIFNEDKFYNEAVIYTAKDEKGKQIVHQVPEDMVDRWLKRGGVIFKDTRPVAPEPESKESKLVETPSQDDLDLLGGEEDPKPVSNVVETPESTKAEEDVEDTDEKPEDKGHGTKGKPHSHGTKGHGTKGKN